MEPNGSRPAHRGSGLNLIDPEAVAARAWVPTPAPRRTAGPAEPGRPVLPGHAVAFRAGPTAPPSAVAASIPDAWTAPTRSERRQKRRQRRLATRVLLAGALATLAIVAAATLILR